MKITSEKHFELTEEFKINAFGIKVFRIKCTKKIKNIKVGELGGFVEKPENLSGDAWVFGDAKVYGNALVYGDAEVSGNAKVSGDAKVYGNADYSCFQSFGRAGRTTTVFREKENKVKINCGCFSGDIEEFEKIVEETHGDSQYGKEYKAIINVIRVKFGL